MRNSYCVVVFLCWSVWACGCGCHPPTTSSQTESAIEESVASPSDTVVEDSEDVATTDGTQEVTSDEAESTASVEAEAGEEVADVSPPTSEENSWRGLFDGETLDNWTVTQFGGEGEVQVEDGEIRFGFGQPMTGITYAGENLPTNNYEIQLEAKRVDGFDFFCALTFPVDDSHCSLVVGGWGGSVVGISSIDDMDASENDTTEYMTFKNDQWYRIRVRVTPGVLEAWIDEDLVVNVDVADRRLSTRIEVDLNKPLGICAFDTQAALRNIQIRELDEPSP